MVSEYKRGDHEAMRCLCFSDHITTRIAIGAGYLRFVHTTAIEERHPLAPAA